MEFSDYVETRPNAATLTGAEKVPMSQSGEAVEANVSEIAVFVGESVGVVQSVTGDGVDNTDPKNPIITSSGGHVIEDEGTPLTQRTKLNFVGAGVTVTDDSGDDASVVTIAGGGGTISDTAFAGSWNGVTTDGASKNALYDEFILKQYLINAAVAITDASTMDITAIKHTLTTSSATRTFTQSYTGDVWYMEIILNTTSCVLTFPATTLTISQGGLSGNNTCTLEGVSGDKYILSGLKMGSNYYVIALNFGQ